MSTKKKTILIKGFNISSLITDDMYDTPLYKVTTNSELIVLNLD